MGGRETGSRAGGRCGGKRVGSCGGWRRGWRVEVGRLDGRVAGRGWCSPVDLARLVRIACRVHVPLLVVLAVILFLLLLPWRFSRSSCCICLRPLAPLLCKSGTFYPRPNHHPNSRNLLHPPDPPFPLPLSLLPLMTFHRLHRRYIFWAYTAHNQETGVTLSFRQYARPSP